MLAEDARERSEQEDRGPGPHRGRRPQTAQPRRQRPRPIQDRGRSARRPSRARGAGAPHPLPGGGAGPRARGPRQPGADPTSSEEGGVRIDVTDTGAGMDAATLERVFQPYAWASPATPRSRARASACPSPRSWNTSWAASSRPPAPPAKAPPSPCTSPRPEAALGSVGDPVDVDRRRCPRRWQGREARPPRPGGHRCPPGAGPDGRRLPRHPDPPRAARPRRSRGFRCR